MPILPTEDFFFGAEIKRTGEYISFELSLTEVDAVEKVGIPVLTRSLSIIAGGRRYRLNVFPMQGWIKEIRRAAEIARKKNTIALKESVRIFSGNFLALKKPCSVARLFKMRKNMGLYKQDQCVQAAQNNNAIIDIFLINVNCFRLFD